MAPTLPFDGRRSEPETEKGDSEQAEAGQVWILWAIADTGEAQVEVPVTRGQVTLVQVNGSESVTSAPGYRLTLELKGDRKMAPPVIVIDRSIEANSRSSPRQ